MTRDTKVLNSVLDLGLNEQLTVRALVKFSMMESGSDVRWMALVVLRLGFEGAVVAAIAPVVTAVVAVVDGAAVVAAVVVAAVVVAVDAAFVADAVIAAVVPAAAAVAVVAVIIVDCAFTAVVDIDVTVDDAFVVTAGVGTFDVFIVELVLATVKGLTDVVFVVGCVTVNMVGDEYCWFFIVVWLVASVT